MRIKTNLNNLSDEEKSLGLSDVHAERELESLGEEKLDEIDNEEEGNTSTSSSLKQHRRWSFTWQIDNIDEVDNIIKVLDRANRYVCQVERAPETGKLHIQGYMEFKSGRTFNGLKKWGPKIHLEVSRGTPQENYDYCTKEESRALGPFYKGFPPIVKLPITIFRDWQAKVWALSNKEPDDRKIYWFFDLNGGQGKTAMAKYLVMKLGALFVNGKATDVKFAVAKAVQDGKHVKHVIWGIPRQNKDYVSYAALEEVKDGLFFSAKYESGQVVINSPHVFVFANFMPQMDLLSADRWSIHDVTNGTLDYDLE